MSFEANCADCIPYICGAYPERMAERYACALRGCSGSWSCGHPSCASFPNCSGYQAPQWWEPAQVDYTTPYVTDFLPGLERILKPMTAGKGCGCCGSSPMNGGAPGAGAGGGTAAQSASQRTVARAMYGGPERRKFNFWWIVLAILLLMMFAKGSRS